MLGKDVVYKSPALDFPGGPVVKCLLANAGYKGLIPVPGRFHMQGNSAHMAQPLKPVCPEPVLHKRSQ